LHLFLGEEDQAAHQSDQTVEFCRVRGEEWLEVFIGIFDRSGLLRRLRRRKVEILRAVEIESVEL